MNLERAAGIAAGVVFIAGWLAWPLLDDWRWILVGIGCAIGFGIVAGVAQGTARRDAERHR